MLGSASFAVAGVSSANPIVSSAGPNSDREITRQVELLIDEHSYWGTMLTVRTKNGVVYLGGSVATPLTLVNANSFIARIPGVQTVVDTAGDDKQVDGEG
jgi:osmotically-inducible protein OsmY